MHARDAEGRAAEVSPRQLARVAAGLREAQGGVADAPPLMTGGRAPPGGVAIKAEAGHPPVHAFPILHPADRRLEGVLGFVPDPAAPETLGPTAVHVLAVLRAVLDPWMLARDSARPEGAGSGAGGAEGFRYDYSPIVTRSPRLHAVFRKLDRVIGARVPVLITGETGTGKELVARALHDNDPQRRNKRFYSQNCGAIASSLLESELFGYVAGAFTGAHETKPGLFQIASGSTLFLDEVGEMSLEMQTRLLRVLQEGEVVPLGSSEPVPIDVRVVAATHRDLEAEVDAGRFRRDLYYRLKVVRVHLPPLRERPEDIPPLIDHFLRKAARESGKRPKVLDRRDPRVLETFTRYAWPGNVRELENVIRRLAYLVEGEVIDYESLHDLDRHLVGPLEREPEPRPVRPLDEVVAEVERAEISNALEVARGNRSRAAALLHINRRSLLRRLKKYGFTESPSDA
ncbi:MAG: sigma-54-dependent Fis family transcriptional regulator [Planctomycetota bacterium]|nr:MAG: sigma-54-dependent Fis family transcriptional regulator [Planctomycetota bacterium]